ncbi:hypothetical protein ACRRS0_08420 [Agarivorans sp. QJM3NY_29]|uniref:hypothetical protein n=1 Tax=unclassified Agarivorans TaxID=2636026 RepID=UPI003D7E6C04
MQQLIKAYQILSEHGAINLQHQLTEQNFMAFARQFIEQHGWAESFNEQGADWQVLGFYLEQQLWWWRYDLLSDSCWFECANLLQFPASCAPLLVALEHANLT